MRNLEEISDEIYSQIEHNAYHEEDGKWELGLLYTEARAHFKSNVAFGKWCDELSVPRGTDKPSRSTITRLLHIVKRFTYNEFMHLGFARARELLSASDWEKHEEQMKHLVSVAPDMTSRELVVEVKKMREGEKFVEPKPKPLSMAERLAQMEEQMGRMAQMEEQMELLRIQNSILTNDYFFSEEEFFSPDPVIRKMQEDHLLHSDHGEFYMLKLWNLPKEYTEEDVTRRYRRLVHFTHPDKGGNPELHELIGVIRELYTKRTPTK